MSLHARSLNSTCSLSCYLQQAVDSGSGQSFVAALKACLHGDNFAQVKLLHSHIIRCCLEMDPYVGNTLIDMYSKFGSARDAHCVFYSMPGRDIVTWNSMISGCVHNNCETDAFELFNQMQQMEGTLPNRITYICILKACSRCSALIEGMITHAQIVENTMEGHVSIGNCLLDMYAKCSSAQNAHKVFGSLSGRDVVTWSTMISGFTEQGQGMEALQIFMQMQLEKLTPNHATYFCALKACSTIPALRHGMIIHAQVIENGFEINVPVGNSLVDMYAKCASFADAYNVLERLPKRDVVSWTSIVANLASHDHGWEALRIFQNMQSDGIKPNPVTYLATLKACSNIRALDEGRLVHSHIIEHGFASNLTLGNTILDMYTKCRTLEDARNVFDHLEGRDAISWSAMILGYAHLDHSLEALQLFNEMQFAGIRPNHVTYVAILKLFSKISNTDQTAHIHSHITKHGFDTDIWINNSLINMYVKCENIVSARKIFDMLAWRDVVTWSTMITGYAQDGNVIEVLNLFRQMQNMGIKPNQVTFVTVLKTCSITGSFSEGLLVHADVIKYGMDSDVCVGNAITHMYVVKGLLCEGKSIFHSLRNRDVVTWTVMIAGYAQHGCFKEAMCLFYQMQQQGIKPNHATFISVFKSCSFPAALSLGNIFHYYIIQAGLDMDISVGNSIVHMYGKLCSVEDSLAVFDRLPKKDVITWSTLIAALSEHGYHVSSLIVYADMLECELMPNQVTLLMILKACSGLGYLVAGQVIHTQVCESGLDLDLPIGNTLIDMYSNCGTLVDAQKVFNIMGRRDVVTWSALIECYVEQDYCHEALHYFGQMLSAEIMPNSITFQSILGACSQIIALEQGMIIHLYVIEEDLQSDVSIGNALLDMYAKCGHCKDAENIFVDLPKENAVAWSSMVYSYAQSNNYMMAKQYFIDMLEHGLKPDDVTFLCLLSACNHAGLVDEGLVLLNLMIEHNIERTADHYNCIMDLLGRTGHLEAASVILETVPVELGSVGLTSLLGHSKTHGDFSLGKTCFLSVLD